MPNAAELGHPDPETFLMGESVPSASFLQFGASVTGIICEQPKLNQQRDFTTRELKTWDDGNPMMQLVVTLQTEEIDEKIEDDDGRRRIYIKSNMKKAVADAVRRAKAKDLAIGGKLTVTYTENGTPSQRGSQPPKLYSAVYVPPTTNFLNSEEPQHNGAAMQRPTAANGANVIEAKVQEIQGKANAGGVKVYLITTDQGEFGTIDEQIAGAVRQLINDVAEITWEPTARGGRKITKIEASIPF